MRRKLSASLLHYPHRTGRAGTFICRCQLVDRLLPSSQTPESCRRLCHWKFQTPISLERDDELGYLAHTMDFMAGALRDYDEDQRKLISNVSHDFRSPLTSIKGYIEAILDGTIPPEMQGKYLNIVLRETERLTGLTHNLLVLNSMNPKQNRLNKTEFDINAVIKNTAAAFEGTCMAKNIKNRSFVFRLAFRGFCGHVQDPAGTL